MEKQSHSWLVMNKTRESMKTEVERQIAIGWFNQGKRHAIILEDRVTYFNYLPSLLYPSDFPLLTALIWSVKGWNFPFSFILIKSSLQYEGESNDYTGNILQELETATFRPELRLVLLFNIMLSTDILFVWYKYFTEGENVYLVRNKSISNYKIVWILWKFLHSSKVLGRDLTSSNKEVFFFHKWFRLKWRWVLMLWNYFCFLSLTRRSYLDQHLNIFPL